jgi:hypothetical protein
LIGLSLAANITQIFNIIHQAMRNTDCLRFLGVLLLTCTIDGFAKYRTAEASSDDHGLVQFRKASGESCDLLLEAFPIARRRLCFCELDVERRQEGKYYLGLGMPLITLVKHDQR